MHDSFFDFSAQAADGGQVPMARFSGLVLLVVNVASQCGFSSQYAGLEALQRSFGPRGFRVLGFPCNQFGQQEPGTPEEIARFCEEKYQVSFPVFAKIDVNGANAAPLFAWLADQRRGLLGSRMIKWNFTKFLIGRDGAPVLRAPPTRTPDQLREPILAALGASATGDEA